MKQYRFTPDGSRVIYRADQQTNDVFELFSVPTTGGAPAALNGPLVAGGSVAMYAISLDSATVIYYADQEVDGLYMVYAAASSQPDLPPGGLTLRSAAETP